MLPKDALKVIPKDYFDTETGTLRILYEEEWRSLGITQVSPPLVPTYIIFRVLDGNIMKFTVTSLNHAQSIFLTFVVPEPHILLFK